MNEKLENLWGKLSLTEEEQTEVVVEEDWIEDEVGRKCLIGKLLLNRRVNVEVMKNVLSNIWKLSSGLTIKEVGSRSFIFQFEDNMEEE